jgi:hypothetical protein
MLENPGLFILVTVILTGLGLVLALWDERRNKELWDKRARTMQCPGCGAAYLSWPGSTWVTRGGKGDRGVVLACTNCSVDT